MLVTAALRREGWSKALLLLLLLLCYNVFYGHNIFATLHVLHEKNTSPESLEGSVETTCRSRLPIARLQAYLTL